MTRQLLEFFSAFASGEAIIELLTLIFLEMVLGIDNLVFIAITTNRLPAQKQHIGRRLGLLGALVMRVLLLCTISFIVGLTKPLFTLPAVGTPITVRSLVLIVGGIYLVYKGITEIRDKVQLKEERQQVGYEGAAATHLIGLPQAVGTIMVMDVVFSLDSVITAVGLVDVLPIMITAVMVAVFVMIIFADPISNFINSHAEIKLLALSFIFLVGVVLVLSGLDIEIPEPMIYFGMFFCLAVELIQMRYNKNLKNMLAENNAQRERSAGASFDNEYAKYLEGRDERFGRDELPDEELRDIVAAVLAAPIDYGTDADKVAVERDLEE